MNPKTILLTSLYLTFAAVRPAIAAGDQIDNPAYQDWSKFKPGSAATYEVSSSAGKQATIVLDLKSVDSERAKIEMTSVVPKQPAAGTPFEVSIPTKVASDQKRPDSSGVEEIKIGDKTFHCQVYVTHAPPPFSVWSDNEPKPEAEIKIWICDQVPGGLVKLHAATTKPESQKGQTVDQVLTQCSVK